MVYRPYYTAVSAFVFHFITALYPSPWTVCISKSVHSESFIFFGGFVETNSGIISSCSANGSMISNGQWRDVGIGGFAAASNSNGVVKNSYTNVDITTGSTRSPDYDRIGGFVGENNGGTFSNCYTTSNIETGTVGTVGGFVAWNKDGSSISKCFCTGNITVSNYPKAIGNFVGDASNGSTLFKCYYNSAMQIKRGETTVTPNNTDGTGANLATLQSKKLLVETLSWSEDVWEFPAGKYPTLKA